MSINETLPELGNYTAGTPESATESIYAGEGTSLSARARRGNRTQNPKYRRALAEAFDLYEQVLQGSRRAAVTFQEAMSTSDFQHLFGDILDRQILANYQQQPVRWGRIARRGRVRDFRQVKRYTLDGGEAVLDEVQEHDEYPAADLTDNFYSYSVTKKGRRIPLSWESMINDDLDAFASIPNRLGNAARRSEERFVTSLFATDGGPRSSFFSSTNKNLIHSSTYGNVPDNPPLDVQGLQYAFEVLGRQVDQDGGPILVEGVTLWVPPALEVPANNIVNATEITTATGSTSDATSSGEQDQLRVANWLSNRVSIEVDPWLPILDPTNGSTAWYLFADPDVGRPAMEVGFLTGHETPELFQKSSNQTRVGGGMADPMDGDFDTDAVEWKLRHVFGGTLMDPKSAVASKGTGSQS